MQAASELWDIIIVGAGSAGLPCALTAAAHGARVLVVEKAAEIGGTLHWSGGHLSAGGTRRQRERGIADNPDLHFAEVMRIAQQAADPALVRLAVDEAPHVIDWLDALGLPWDPITPRLVYGHEPYKIARTYYGVDGGRSILETLRPSWDEHVAARQITVLFEHTLTALLVEGGVVSGIRAQNASGTVELRGRRVVLTSGGYAANHKLFAEVTPTVNGIVPKLVSTARPTSTGDGIIAARQHGAQLRNADKYLASLGGLELEPGSGWADYQTAWAMVFTTSYRPPREIYVNTRGERFMAEDEPSPDRRERLILQQPEHKFWCVFDERGLTDGAPLVKQWNEAELRRHAAAGKCMWQAETLAELAHKTGIDKAGLLATVEKFNLAAQMGEDAWGRRDLQYTITQPPYYALLTHATSLLSFGGLTVNANLQVLNEAGAPIPNLYAAGEILGAAALMGQSFCGGMSLTPCLSFGRILGRRLAA
ncbi:MAG: FAD-dependent oxidoreductase [Acidobacteria bacterium]|nr:FAD-dependent oxidoreductase [Acidobacteriota bacterium]MBI3427407.1 FAD-dependent oxidoreductase [Acidobacteriota bacterium]